MARPRSVRAHTAVLDAALELFADRGLDGTSVDAIAERSGVSKATIYKHWPDKDTLSIEVLAHAVGRDEPAPDVDSGHLRSDLIAVLGHRPPERHEALRTRLMPHLLAYSARNPAFGRAWRARVLDPPREQLRRVLLRAITRRELPADLDVDTAIVLLHGPLMYAHMLTLMQRTPPDRLPDAVVDTFLRAYARPTSKHAARRDAARLPVDPSA